MSNVFRQPCRCGCGGFEAVADDGTLYVHWFTSDWYARQSPVKSGLTDRMKYLSGDRLLREAVIEREDFIAFRDFLKNVAFDPDKARPDSVVPSARIVPIHLMEELYAIWLEGRLPPRDIIRGRFHRMFEVELSSEDRDILVIEMDKWLARESKHSIPDGESPHVTRLTKGVDDPADVDPDVPAGHDPGSGVADGDRSVQAARPAAAAPDPAAPPMDPDPDEAGSDGDAGWEPVRDDPPDVASGMVSGGAIAMDSGEDEFPDLDGLPDGPDESDWVPCGGVNDEEAII